MHNCWPSLTEKASRIPNDSQYYKSYRPFFYALTSASKMDYEEMLIRGSRMDENRLSNILNFFEKLKIELIINILVLSHIKLKKIY